MVITHDIINSIFEINDGTDIELKFDLCEKLDTIFCKLLLLGYDTRYLGADMVYAELKNSRLVYFEKETKDDKIYFPPNSRALFVNTRNTCRIKSIELNNFF